MQLVAYGANPFIMLNRPVRVLDEERLVQAMRLHFAAKRIQRAWDACLSNPCHKVGKKRLVREFQEIERGVDYPAKPYSYYKRSCGNFDDVSYYSIRYLDNVLDLYGPENTHPMKCYFCRRNGIYQYIASPSTKCFINLLIERSDLSLSNKNVLRDSVAKKGKGGN